MFRVNGFGLTGSGRRSKYPAFRALILICGFVVFSIHAWQGFPYIELKSAQKDLKFWVLFWATEH